MPQGDTPNLVIVSLTKVFENYELDSNDDLIVEWTVPKKQNIHLRARGLNPQFDYRMDTFRDPGSTSYSWPIDILRNLGISRNDVGVIGWGRYSISGVVQDVYLPLRIWQKKKPTELQVYRVVLFPGRELTEVFISLARLQPDGKTKQFILDEEPLEYGYYPAGRGVEFDVSEFREPGVYYLEIAATFRSGGSDTISIWFYHAG